jgi:hypothetical protein
MDKSIVLNKIINKFKYVSYLEIGVSCGHLFSKINCKRKVGVDPYKNFANLTYKMISDDFFLINKEKFDIVFIDGLHHCEQVDKDFENSLKILQKKGLILFHDCNPTCKEHQGRNPIVTEWTGDCWKSFVKIRQNYNVETFVIDTDWGIGVFNPSIITDNKLSLNIDLSYENFNINKKNWLNLKTINEFEEWLVKNVGFHRTPFIF